MGCVSSHLLNQDDDFNTSTLSHHIVSLTSTTYGLLSLDPSSSPTTIPPTLEPPPLEVINSWELMAGLDHSTSFRFSPQPSKPSPFRNYQNTLNPNFQENDNPNLKDPIFLKEIKNPYQKDEDKENPFGKNPILQEKIIYDHQDPFSLEEKANFKNKGSIFIQEKENPYQKTKNFQEKVKFKHQDLIFFENKEDPYKKDSIFIQEKENPFQKEANFAENVNFYHKDSIFFHGSSNPSHEDQILSKNSVPKWGFLDGFEALCPPEGEEKVVIYTTSLRGVRRTFEACNAVRAVLEGFGVFYCERDISMDRGFRDELWELMKGKEKAEMVPPRVFVKGRYVGGVDDCLRMVEDGCLGDLLEGLPKSKAGYVCEVCGGARFLPCLGCNGSCKIVTVLEKEIDGERLGSTVTVKCTDCNENGLIRCTNCS